MLTLRQYCMNRIRFAFRDNVTMFSAKRLNMILKNGKKALRTLKKANGGDAFNMEKVLRHTYARSGRRKADILLVYPHFSRPNLIALLPRENSPNVAFGPRLSSHSTSCDPTCHKTINDARPQRRPPIPTKRSSYIQEYIVETARQRQP